MKRSTAFAAVAIALMPVTILVAGEALDNYTPTARSTAVVETITNTPIAVPVVTPAPARASRSSRPTPPGARAATEATRASSSTGASVSGWHNLGTHEITAYCWTGNRNSAGQWPRIGDVAVIDRSIPFGTRVRIEGLGEYVVRDWIGHGSEFDVFMGRDGCQARAVSFGRQHLEVELAR